MATESNIENVSFQLVPLLNISHNITSLSVWGTKLFVGTYEGKLLIYNLTRTFRDNKEFLSVESTSQVTIGNKPIDKVVCLSAHQETVDDFIFILSGGVVTLHTLKALHQSPLVMKKHKEVNTICCSDDTQFYGVCINVKRRLYLYKLSYHIELFKEFQLPEIPRDILWCKNYLCLGFSKEYSFLDVDTGAALELPKMKVPPTSAFLRVLPFDQLVITTQRNIMFVDFQGRERRSAITLTESPLALAFSYPFLFSLLRSSLEVKNIFDPLYHEILRKPSENFNFLVDDGRTVLLAEKNSVYVVQAQSITYQVIYKENIHYVFVSTANVTYR
jgi:hypothetical protein